MLLLLLSSALAADCPERLTTERWSSRMRALREEVALINDGMDLALKDLEGDALCVDAPLSATDLAALWLAHGARDVLSEQTGDKTAGFFTAAKAIGGENAWDPIYGPLVERWFREAAPGDPAGSFTFYLPNDVLVINGEVVYEPGPHRLFAGAHLVQWSTDGLWTGEWVVLAADEARVIGEPPVVVVDTPVAPEPALSGGAALRGGVVGLGAGGLASDMAGNPLYYSGRDGAPLLAADVWIASDRWWVRFSGVGVDAPTLADLPWPMGLGAYGGLHRGEGRRSLDVGLGLRVVIAPTVQPVAQPTEPWDPAFERNPALVGAALVEARLGGDLGLAARADALAGPAALSVEVGLGPSLRLNDAIELGASGSVGALQRPGDSALRMGWWSATGGTRWSF